MSNVVKCIGLHGAGLDLSRLKSQARKSDYETIAQKHLNEYQDKLTEVYASVQPVVDTPQVSPFEVAELTAARSVIKDINIEREISYTDHNGDITTTSFKALLDEVDSDLRDLPLIEQATQAAITCFLKFGDILS